MRWRIERGLLVARAGRGGDGYLQIDMRRRGRRRRPGTAALHVEVEVANFYPAIASRLSALVYTNTQSRIHVIVTHGFLRSLARLDLAESRSAASPRRYARGAGPASGTRARDRLGDSAVAPAGDLAQLGAVVAGVRCAARCPSASA